MCPKAKLDPTQPLESGEYPIDGAEPAPIGAKFVCDPNYEDCIPSYPPDLDCKDIKLLGLTNVKIIGTDVHKLDFDGDGIACES